MQLVDKYRPQEPSGFIGIERPKAILSAFLRNPYASAWLLLGPSGLGKTTMAFAAAKALGATQQVGGGIYHVPARKCDLETIDRIVGHCYSRPMLGCPWNIVLIDEADRMTMAAQHALLSKLDCADPPPDTIWLLTANSTTNLEDRFISRCRTIKFTTDGLLEPGIEFMRRIWKAEAPKKAPAPDFAAIMREARLNFREALMILETEVLCPGSFQPSTEFVAPPKTAAPAEGQRIYTVGYAGLSIPELREVLDAFKISLLVDCRTSPKSRIMGFGKAQLERAFGERYTWAGDKLGGGGRTTDAGLSWLGSLAAANRPVMLLCKEEAPGNCHRHHTIAVPLSQRGIPVVHVYNNELITAAELQRSIDEDNDYRFTTWRQPAAVSA